MEYDGYTVEISVREKGDSNVFSGNTVILEYDKT